MHRRERIQEFCEIPNVVLERFQGLRVVGASLGSQVMKKSRREGKSMSNNKHMYSAQLGSQAT
jgi:hypothetical protein